MIPGITLTPLKVLTDARGSVLHMLRTDAPHFEGFGEIYFSTVNRGMVKGWKKHHRMTLNLAVPVGRIRLVVADDRSGSPTAGEHVEIVLGPDNYQLATIAPGLWTAFQGLGSEPSLLANCANIPHDPAESESRSLDDPPVIVDWKQQR